MPPMWNASAILIFAALIFTAASQVHSTASIGPVDASTLPVYGPATGSGGLRETLEVYYSPLTSTAVIRYAGFGMAHHMAIVYTDRTGTSFGASSGPSNLAAAQTPRNAVQALVATADDGASSFGILVPDPHNDTPFVIGRDGEYYTCDRDGRPYPRALMMTGADLSAQWTLILQTYALVGSERLPYSPTTQNSNSLAGTALRRVGVSSTFSSETAFAPGIFTEIPLPEIVRRSIPDAGFVKPKPATEAPSSSDGATVM